MLDSAQIQVSCLLVWVGTVLGVTLPIVDSFVGGEPTLARIGLSLLILSTGYSVRSSIARRDKSMRDAFGLGVAHGRSQAKALHTVP